MPTTRRPRGGCPTDIDAAVVARADALGLLVDLICHRIDAGAWTAPMKTTSSARGSPPKRQLTRMSR
jgi:hypothetical protein